MGSRLVGSVGCVALPVFCLVSLVSVLARNWCYLCERIERVEKGETVEIANVHAVVMQVAENMVGWQKRLGEYPTLSASFSCPRSPDLLHSNVPQILEFSVRNAIRAGRRGSEVPAIVPQ